jgi:hypothetical protein
VRDDLDSVARNPQFLGDVGGAGLALSRERLAAQGI